MYEIILVEIFLWSVFVKRKRKTTNLKQFLKWTVFNLISIVLANTLKSNASLILDDNTQLNNELTGEYEIPETVSNKFSNSVLTDQTNNQESLLPIVQQSNNILFRHTFFVSAIYFVAYLIVFIIGLVGNCVVMIVVIKSSRMRNATNFFICNLAFADTLVIIFCLPVTLLGHLFVPWILGLVLCKLVSYLQGVAVSASINTLVAVSIERYLAICFPFNRPMSRRKAKKWIIIIWIFSLTLFTPWAYYFKTIQYQSTFNTSSQETKMTAQKLIQTDDLDNSDDIQMNKIDNNLKTEQINKFLKQQKRLDLSINNCKFKRLFELDLLNTIYRFILNNYLNQFKNDLIDLNLDNRIHNLEHFLEETLIQTVNLDFNLVLIDQLNQIIQQISETVCQCFESIKFIDNLNRTIKTTKKQSNYLNHIFKQLNELLNYSTNLTNLTINSQFLTNSINLTTIDQLNDLRFSLIKQIELRIDDQFISNDCNLDCDNSFQPLCPLIYLFTNQTKLVKSHNQPISNRRYLRSANESVTDQSAQSDENNNQIKFKSNETYESNNYEICREEWPNKSLEQTYFIITNLILNYLLPLIIISACYICIWVTVWKRSVPCETSVVTSNKPILKLPRHSCRITYAKKPIDQQSNASSSKSTKSLLIHTFSGLKTNLFPINRLKHSSSDNLKNNHLTTNLKKRNPSLLVKLEEKTDPKSNQCYLCSNELESNIDYEMAKNEMLIKDQLVNEQKCKKRVKKSLVCNYDQSNQKNQMTNTKQQIMTTIDSSPTNSTNDSSLDVLTPMKTYKSLQNKFKKFMSNKRQKKERSFDDENNEIKNNDASDSSSNKEFKIITKNDLDYEIEFVNQNEKLKQYPNEKKLNSRNSYKYKHKIELESKEEKNRIDRSLVERVSSKRSLNDSLGCLKCRNVNNNCECKTHNLKQLIKSTKSTPIIGSDRLIMLNEKSKRNPSQNQFKITKSRLDTSAQLNNQIEVILQRSRYKVAKMMIIIISVFFVCWLPLYIIFTKLKLGLQFTRFTQMEEKITFTLAPFVQWICYINSCLNPVLYFYLNKKYRTEFKKLFSNVSFLRCKLDFKRTKKRKNTSIILKASSFKSQHPSINTVPNQICEKNFEKTSEQNDQRDFKENKKVAKLSNNFVHEQYLIDKPKVRITRSLNDINLQNTKINVNRVSFSGSLN